MSLSLIVLGGTPPSVELLREFTTVADISIAADSGLASFQAADLQADIAVGDFDSFIGKPAEFARKVIPAPEQDATDFQKALRSVKAHSAGDAIAILGGTGLRADHFLTNLLIIAEKWPTAKIAFHDDQQSLFRVNKETPLRLENMTAGRTVSLIPFSRASGVTTHGLHWPLSSASMEPNGQLGQSNRVSENSVEVSVSAGILYVIVNRDC